jgi:hypothetical protein
MRASESQSVKKRWLSVESTVFYIEAVVAFHYLVSPRVLTLTSLRIMDFFRPRLVAYLSCVLFGPSTLRTVNPLKLGRPC